MLEQALIAWGVEELKQTIEIRWNQRLRTTIGRANLLLMVLELNPTLLARNPEGVPHVLIHEAAHLVARYKYGPRIAPHGSQWKSLMLAAGESPRATHSFDTTGLRNRRRRAGRQPTKRKWIWW